MHKEKNWASRHDDVLGAILNTNHKQEKARYRLSQSLVKEMTDTTDCPLRIKTHSLEQLYVRPTSDYMIKGQLFEYLALGNLTREGTIPRLKPVKVTKKNPAGEMSADERRIREQARVFWDQMAEWGFEVIDRDVKIKWRYNAELEIDGIIDIRARRHGQPCIVDVKCTADLTSDFGFYAFGDFATMDKIQADMYMYIEHRNYELDLPFYYAVFDYKKVPERALFETSRDVFREATLHSRILASLESMKQYEQEGWPVRPSYDTCTKKCGNLACPFRITERPPKL